ncbi:hypothetical protein MLD38_016894 [Melastoma candidum]|uniref:Uncharacterized protein n=1 Tax=Melastoma candidum TaxID=119954 RepID=A0ACB9QQR3_9MYRT|nr:hypothetical protein MLD38_016894 [Melastoma candidum]
MELGKSIVVAVVGGLDEIGWSNGEWYIVGGVGAVLGILLILLVVFIACKPWRYFRSSTRSHLVPSKHRVCNCDDPRSWTLIEREISLMDALKWVLGNLSPFVSSCSNWLTRHPLYVEGLDRPLIQDDVEACSDEVYSSTRAYNLEGPGYQEDGYLRPPRIAGLIHKQRLPVSSPRFNQGISVVVDVPDPADGICVGQTLKRPLGTFLSFEKQKVSRKEDSGVTSEVSLDVEQPEDVGIKVSSDQRSCLTLDVLSGPSQGTRYSVQSTDTPGLPLTMGRVSPSDLLVKDSEVSGKHAMINWNLNKLKWELVDMGSLNGTLLNSQPINHPDSGSRHWGDPFELASGDIITVGTTSTISVQIVSPSECSVPFGVGLASDPMSMRRGGKKLPMEDVSYYQWPIPGHEQFGFFGICDGHGGAEAAKFASKCMPETLATVLSESFNKEKLLSQKDASHVLRETFYRTEEIMNHYYEGCTATLLLIWLDGSNNLIAQCSNVGDSACIMNVDGNLVRMTEDHRVVSSSERLRIEETGEPLRDGETRLCGLNLARMLGDKFLKQQDARFSSEPYVSQVVQIDRARNDFAIIASDGFWDVVGMKKSIQLVSQMMERHSDAHNCAEKIANSLLDEARKLRTKDNTSIIFLDFGKSSRVSSSNVEI